MQSLVIDHIDGDEWNDAPENLRYLCRADNAKQAVRAVRLGLGRRTRQYNPGAETLREYVEAAVSHRRGEHDEGGRILHHTPKEIRREFAAEIWRRRRARGT